MDGCHGTFCNHEAEDVGGGLPYLNIDGSYMAGSDVTNGSNDRYHNRKHWGLG